MPENGVFQDVVIRVGFEAGHQDGECVLADEIVAVDKGDVFSFCHAQASVASRRQPCVLLVDDLHAVVGFGIVVADF